MSERVVTNGVGPGRYQQYVSSGESKSFHKWWGPERYQLYVVGQVACPVANGGYPGDTERLEVLSQPARYPGDRGDMSPVEWKGPYV